MWVFDEGLGILAFPRKFRLHLVPKRGSSFPSRPLIIRVPFFLLFGFNKGTQKEKG